METARKQGLCGRAIRIAAIFATVAVPLLAAEDGVKIWQEPLVLPTYRIGEPDPNPRFYAGRTHQGAEGRVYPYPMLDVLTDDLEDRSYTALYLENRYVKICVLPELGGRLFSAVDKTNGYDFFYRQSAIKPVLIGMLGAWISGGIEWNVPHHHRATTFMPVDYALKRNPGGSATIWVGEMEIRHRMRWAVGLTLYPDRSTIELTGRLFNQTPFVNSILFWSNPAVHANEHYQVIFPPSTEYVTQHAKREFAQWPVANARYGGYRYENVDISWFKNLLKPVSFFAWNRTDDYFGGYDHGQDAGVVHVANHHVVPGKKFWTFAAGAQGRMWHRMLSDGDGPYIELMAGACSDNQPDYSWCQPYEMKSFKQVWFPIRKMGGFKYANLRGALNLELEPEGVARVRLNTTAPHRDARVVLEGMGKTLFEATVAIGPEEPFARDVALSPGVKEENLHLLLRSATGEELLSYRPARRPGAPMPDPVKPPAPPKEIGSVEELYLTGLRLEQFHNAALDPYAYYEEALRRDPGNARVNARLGSLYCRRGMFEAAREKLTTAIRRITRNYTRPIDGEPFYYLGVTLRALGEHDAAYDAFYKATWSLAWTAASHYALSQLDCRRGDFSTALEHLDRALSLNGLNTNAMALKAAVLRRLGRPREAAETASMAAGIDPLDFWSRNELCLAGAQGDSGEKAAAARSGLKSSMRENDQSYLELAAAYGNCGLWDEAIDVLSRVDRSTRGDGSTHPMVYYTLGHLWEQKGDRAKSRAYYGLASRMSPDFCFPFRLESIEILEQALQQNPSDHRALYYLGNLLYDLQPDKAIEKWERSRDLDGSFHLVHRNLSFAYSYAKNDIPKALACMDAALARKGDDPRLYYERDVLAEAGKVPVRRRLAVLEDNLQTVLGRDDSTDRIVRLYVVAGEYDKAIRILETRHFHTWEGGGRIHDVYVDAHLLRGREAFKRKEYREALRHFEAALEYPENLEVGRPIVDEAASRTHCLIGKAHKALRDEEKARESFQRSVAIPAGETPFLYEQGLAYGELGKDDEARRLFDRLIETGENRAQSGEAVDFFAKFGERQSHERRLAAGHYMMALGHLGKGDRARAAGELRRALELNMGHVWARAHLADLEGEGP